MKKLSTLIVSLLAVIGASGQKISAVKALEKAQAFAQKMEAKRSKGHSGKALTLNRLAQSDVLNQADGDELYVYNIGQNDGFVIVSGDERVPDILGYAGEGSINPQQMPENMRWWLQMYADEIKHLEGNAEATSVPTHPAIAPLLTCTWNQNAPYNLMCPMDDGRGKTSYTGCVATAMAQALYHVRPQGSSSIDGYQKTYNDNKVKLSNLPATTFNWDIMRDSYSSDDNDASAEEVAKLMRYCGQGAKIGYSAAASGTTSKDAHAALTRYFGITNECKLIYREKYDKTGWDNYIYRELSNDRVVIFSGGNFDSGHEFVCDGYDGNGLYHINWGWGGKSNGYFEINHLNPDDQGIGGSNGGYSSRVDAIVNIKLATGTEEDIIVPCTYQWVSMPETVERTDNTQPFTFDLSTKFVNFNFKNNNYEVCLGLFDSSDYLFEQTDKASISIQFNTDKDVAFNCKMGANLSDGKYYIKPLGHQQGATRWEPCMYSDKIMLIATINGNKLTLTELPLNTNPSFTCSNISIDSNPIAGIPTPLTATVENTGSTYSSEIYVIVDGKAVTSIAANLDPGEQETFSIDLIFDTTGTKEIWMARGETNSYNGVTNYIQISSKISCTVVAEQICPVIISNFKVKNYTEHSGGVYTIGSTSCTVTADVTNTSGNTYNSSIGFFEAWYNSDGRISYHTTPMGQVSVSVPSGTTKTVEYTFTNLDKNNKYRFLAYYKATAVRWASYYWYDNNIAADVVIDNNTGIDNVTISNVGTNEPTYTLDGRQISTPQHGIYIRGGKKYVK